MKKQTFIVTKGELIKRLPHLKAFYEIPDTIELQGVPVLKCTKVHNHKKSSVCVDNPKPQEEKCKCKWTPKHLAEDCPEVQFKKHITNK